MKKISIIFILTLAIFASVLPQTFAADTEISLILDGKHISFDVAPQIIFGRTMVPIRGIFEAIGASVKWNGDTQTAVCTKGDTTVEMTIGSNINKVNGKNVKMDIAPVIVNDRTLAPARYVAESFGATVKWDEINKNVIILYKTILGGTQFDLNTTKGLLSHKTGEIVDGSRYISDYLDIKNGLVLKNVLQVVDGKFSTICYYDENKNFVKSERFSDNSIKEKEIFPDADYQYIRYTSATKSLKYQRYMQKKDALSSQNFGKKVAVFGGSFATVDLAKNALNHWGQKLGFVTDVYAVGGAGFRNSTANGANHIQAQVNKACAKDAPLYDIYVLWASTNDIWAGADYIGSTTDYTAKDNYDETKLNTQCGGINYCIKKIYEKNPNAKICFLTSIRAMSAGAMGYDINYSGENGLNKFVDAQIACCKQWKIPYLDQFRNVDINPSNKSTYVQDDNLHLKDEGYDLIKDMQVKFLSEI